MQVDDPGDLGDRHRFEVPLDREERAAEEKREGDQARGAEAAEPTAHAEHRDDADRRGDDHDLGEIARGEARQEERVTGGLPCDLLRDHRECGE